MGRTRCLVLGAGGFIGLNLCMALRRSEIDVTGFGRAPAPPAGLPDLDWRSGEIGRLADPDALVAGQTHVFDLIDAGSPGGATRNATRSAMGSATGITATDAAMPKVALLEACRRQGVERIVFASSGGTVYGNAGPEPITENAPTAPISAYGANKLEVENVLRLYRQRHGLDHRILRIGNAYGPHQHPLRGQGLVSAVLFRLMRDEPIQVWGDGRTVRDYVHIDDVVSAILLAAFSDDPATRLCNVGSGEGRDVISVIGDSARMLGRTPLLEYRPGRSTDVRCNVLDASRLRRATGWMPRVGWEAGLAGTAAWLTSAFLAAPVGGDPVRS